MAKRRKTITARFEILYDLCESYDKFSESERKENLLKNLALFSKGDHAAEQNCESENE